MCQHVGLNLRSSYRKKMDQKYFCLKKVTKTYSAFMILTLRCAIYCVLHSGAWLGAVLSYS
jgi:hypothetical protein